jgi:hypothetical protein
MSVVDHKDVQKYLGRGVVPIMPFLIVKCRMRDDKVLDARIEAILTGFIPNTPQWCAKFNTNALHVAEKVVAGRWLFRNEQEMKEV